MRRALLLLVGVLAVISAGLAAVYAWLFWTPPGRQSLTRLIETEIGDAIGGAATIGALQGDLPGEVIIRNLSLSGDEGEWLIAPEVRLVWNPAALMRRKVDIRLLSIDGARLLGRPPARERDNDRPKGFQLPDRLPSIVVDRLQLNNLELDAALAGRPIRLDGGGAVRMGGRDLFIQLDATAEDDSDFLAVRIERQGDALTSKMTATSKEDGAIAAIAGLGGALFIEAEGEGALADYSLDFDARIGAYGEAAGVISGDLERMQRIAIAARAMLGARFANTARIIGKDVDVKAAILPVEDGAALEIEKFHSALGAAAGTASWRNGRDGLEEAKIAARADFAADWRPDIRRYLGDALSIDATVTPTGSLYRVAGAAKASLLDAVIDGAETDLKGFIRGAAKISLRANDALPTPIRDGAEAEGTFNLVFDDGVSATNAQLTAADGAAFRGDAAYAFRTKAFSAKGDLSAPGAYLSRFDPKVEAKQPASATLDLSGALDDFSGRIVATVPTLRYGETTWPAMRVTIAGADMPSRAKGRITVRAIDESRRFTANFARTTATAWRFGAIDFVGADFAMKGSAAYDRANGEGAIDLAYRGRDGAEPLPGIALAGDFTAKGALRRGEKNRVEIKSQALASKTWSLSALEATAEGSPEKLTVKAKAARVDLAGAAPAEALAASMIVEPQLGPKITLTALDADIGGAPARLSERATVMLDDGVSIDRLRASFGRKGSIAVDAKFEDRRWRGVVRARKAPIVRAASTIDLDLDLDTDRKLPASGTFTLASQLTKTETARLSGRFDWDGSALRLRDAGDGDAIDLDLSAPVRLIRAPALSIDMSGPIAGEARYQGRAETIAGFLPAAFQSLEGDIEFDARAAGTLKDPKFAGDLAIRNGAFTELSSGLSIVNIEANARAAGAATGSRIRFDASGSGLSQKEKTITASGEITIAESASLNSQIAFTNARISAGPINAAEASGNLTLSGPFTDLLAQGKINIRNLDAQVITPEPTGLVDIAVVAVAGDGERARVGMRAAPPAAIRYDISIEGDDRIFIRGRGLESEWRADVQVAGRANKPTILGFMRLRNGDISFAGRRFDMTRGEIVFDNLSVNNPVLDLKAERTTRSGVLAAIVIAGRADAPKITLESTPALPQEDVMALILFDKPANELSALESLQVAEGLAELGGIGPFGGNGVTGSARQALGLDMFNVDFDEADSSASTLTVGKYVADGLFVSATQDARGQNGSVRIEYEIDDSFTVETELRQDGDQTVSANWKHDF